MTNDIVISSLDFMTYKNSLKTFLKTQTQFKDYDFEGSNMSVLLDVLAYNTFHNNFYNNMTIAEMFLDTAQLRSSVVSHAKSLNYTPRSRRAASATITVTLRVEDNAPFVTIPARTPFNAPNTNKGRAMVFYTHDSHTIIPENGVYSSNNIHVYEGSLVNEKFFVSTDKHKKYPIGNANVDTNTLKVFVTNLNGIEEEYILATSLHNLRDKSKVYFLQLTDDTYEIYFGANIFGKAPAAESIIRMEYLVTNGEEANGICEFLNNGSISGHRISRVIPVTPAYGGAAEESIDSIKLSAMKSYQVQDRAVTETDYTFMLKNNFPEVTTISVVGGEELKPPRYGNVFIYVDTKDIEGISEFTKDKIKTFIKPRMPMGISVNVETPNFFYMDVKSEVKFNTTTSNKSTSDIRNVVYNNIKNFVNLNLNTFGAKVRHSKIETEINNSDNAIISNVTDIRIYAERELLIAKRNDFTINFGIELMPITDYAYRAFASENPNVASLPDLNSALASRPPTVASSFFRFEGSNVYIRDNGAGTLQIVRQSGNREVVLNKNIGSVNYQTGSIKINRLIIQGYIGSGVKFYVVPKSRDFNVPKNSILSIRNEDLKVTATVA